MQKKILVFGAAGFLGTYLTDKLVELNFDVTASDINDFGKDYYDSKKIKYVEIDIRKRGSFDVLKNESFDVVIHLAAHQPANVCASSYDPKDYIEVNVKGTLNILSYCEEIKAGKIIYASSHRNTQGLWETDKPVEEEDGRKIKYDTEYTMFSISESAAQDCVQYYQHQHGLQGVIFRLPPIYGYGPHTEIFKDGKAIKTGFQIFVDKAMACEPLEVWGKSDVGRDIVYIKDVIDAFVKAIHNDNATGLFNITSGRKLTLMQEAKTIAKVFWGNDSEPIIVERTEKDNGIDSFYYDITKAKEELDWSPMYSFEDMLYDFIKEGKSKKFSYLIEKRKKMLETDG